ncbi:MarR family transcriptional regulator [Rhodococcus jostii RHA1] [Mycobacterium shimoidei]|uniref:MarR family transcriptional regulator [Rhodococcus jostii RHA1] n=1 Tax=Mycobacterium shimoidei TaxID=29313 RepID=A0A375YY88_MYCSH|nr:helix-turn-helix domain-containing protein [Mycobacterium shimoidei]SRX93817.1 MarR family transcriptional regulator [Rhodococcus jostii RHA1] [Mycobacterium shimoidei]
MPVRELLHADESAPPALGESRARVLAVLQDAGRPLGVSEVATRVELHKNTTRFHLEALVEAGIVDRASEEREHPGRPRMLYTARSGAARAGKRSYRLLAEILTSYVAAETPEPAQAAVQAGQAWGRYLADRPPPFRRIDADTATKQLVDSFDEIGFMPEAITTGRRRQILLHHCPFRETAEEHREVVCSIHLGLTQGILAAIDAPIEAERLEPFVEPDLCVADLTERKIAKPAKRSHRS